MRRLLISQRVRVDQHGEPCDVLEKSLVIYFSSYGIKLYPVSNFLSDPGEFVQGVKYDGLILSGGGDVNPQFIDMKDTHRIDYSPEREQVETFLIEKALEEGLPILGICHGMQQLNCYFGGRITADIHSAEKATRRPRLNHSIRIEKKLFGLDSTYDINHYHDNGIRKAQIAPTFDIFALDSECDVIEGIVHKNLPILGINWHPERESPDNEINKIIIKGFFNL